MDHYDLRINFKIWVLNASLVQYYFCNLANVIHKYIHKIYIYL